MVKDAGGRAAAGWSMGAVTLATGISHHTLRAWERRYGFPRPGRLSSGHRRYSEEQVGKLRLVVRALEFGHRPADLVALSVERLLELLAGTPALGAGGDAWPASAIDRARQFDRDGLRSDLLVSASRLGAREFLRASVEPLLRAVGRAWQAGELDIRHEHFLSEVVEDVLRAVRSPLEAGTVGRPVLLTTLPGESHTLGVQMAALTVVVGRRPVRLLGPQTPIDEIVAAAVDSAAAAVGVSVSLATATPASAQAVRLLRWRLDPAVALWIGGAGAERLGRPPAGCLILPTLGHLERALCRGFDTGAGGSHSS